MSIEAILALVVGFALMFALIFLAVPVAWALLVSGIVGFTIVAGIEKALWVFNYQIWATTTMDILVCLPLFILMGRIVFESGLGSGLFRLASSFVQRIKGGLAMALSITCGVFGAISGSTPAALATFGPIAIPEMSKYRYNKNYSAAVLACSGTFAAMIPPSIMFIIYGWLTDTSITKLFMAGLIPGIITVVAYCFVIYFSVKRNPSLAPAIPPKVSWRQRGRLTLSNIPILCVALVVLGGIYMGWFTATESAGVGCFLVLVLALATRRMGWKGVKDSFLGVGPVVAMLLFLLVGAKVLATFVVVTGAASAICEFIVGLGLNPYLLILAIFILFLVEGSLAGGMLVLVVMVPILLPAVLATDFSAIWFGVFVVKAGEIAAVTPPVGLNVFITEGATNDPEVHSGTIFRFIVPFVIADTFVLALITFFPQVCLWLPATMS